MPNGIHVEPATAAGDTPKRPSTPSVQSKAAERSALLAELAGQSAPAAPEPQKAKPAAAKPGIEKPEEPDPGDELDDGDGEGEADDGEGEGEGAAKAAREPADDADTQKRLDKVKAAEKRMRLDHEKRERELTEKMDRREREFQRREQDMTEKLDRLTDFEKLGQRAKYDPVAVLKALGLSDDDLDDAGKVIYAHSTAGAKDPKNKEAAARLMKEREERDRVAKLEKRLADMDSERETERERAGQRQAVEQFLDETTKVVTDESPVVQIWLEKAPKKARAAMAQLANHLAEQAKGLPDAEDVIAELEKWRRTELEENDIDIDDMIAKWKAKKGKSATEETKKATTETKQTKTETKAKPAKRAARNSRADRDGILQELAAFRAGTAD